jgi:hypothetical protein
MINWMMENHSCLRSHLGRVGIVESPTCVCSRDYETIDHVLWGCERFGAERAQLWMDLRWNDTEWGAPIRDILGGRDWRGLRVCCFFLSSLPGLFLNLLDSFSSKMMFLNSNSYFLFSISYLSDFRQTICAKNIPKTVLKTKLKTKETTYTLIS